VVRAVHFAAGMSRANRLLLVPALLAIACVTTTTTTREWTDDGGGEWARYGRVESARETVRRSDGNPAAGAVAGAIVGGLLGSMIGGHTDYDRWGRAYYHGSGEGAAVGAVGGAVVGAAASQGSSEDRWSEVVVRFEDGGLERFTYQGPPPFRPGDLVVQTPRGLQRG
jgi:outer membrane lipoprotein SlyB